MKLHWLFELLMESPLSGEGGSFRDARYVCVCTWITIRAEYVFMSSTIFHRFQVSGCSSNLSWRMLSWRAAVTQGPPLSLNPPCLFVSVSLLYVLQGGLAQQQWRVSELLHRLLAYLEPKLTQVYKNVRERIGRYQINLVLSLLDYIIMVK